MGTPLRGYYVCTGGSGHCFPFEKLDSDGPLLNELQRAFFVTLGHGKVEGRAEITRVIDF